MCDTSSLFEYSGDKVIIYIFSKLMTETCLQKQNLIHRVSQKFSDTVKRLVLKVRKRPGNFFCSSHQKLPSAFSFAVRKGLAYLETIIRPWKISTMHVHVHIICNDINTYLHCLNW